MISSVVSHPETLTGLYETETPAPRATGCACYATTNTNIRIPCMTWGTVHDDAQPKKHSVRVFMEASSNEPSVIISVTAHNHYLHHKIKPIPVSQMPELK